MIPFNHEVAGQLRKISDLLAAQKANPFRIRAYLNAAAMLDELEDDVERIVQEKGVAGLIELPAIGAGIARSIYEYVATGRMAYLENLQGAFDPVGLLQTIPAVGKVLAQRIHEQLHVDTFEALQNVARDGELENLDGLGKKRLEAIEAWLLKHFSKNRLLSATSRQPGHNPSIPLVLKVDKEYRQKAEAGKLPLITPKRFNPENKNWLPILHASYQGWHFTALYSNTSRAHQLKRIHDWVVIFFYDDDHEEGQHTVVTETRGALHGKRVVRGREAECIEYYESSHCL